MSDITPGEQVDSRAHTNFLAKLAANETTEATVFTDQDVMIDHLNTIGAVLLKGNDLRIVVWGRDGEPIFLRESQAKAWLAKYKVEIGEAEKAKLIPAYGVWIGSARRREYTRLIFNPNPATRHDGDLELFTGLAVTPGSGDWSLLRTHVFENICQHNEETFLFLMHWMAQLMQQPWRKIGVCIVLRGKMGTGKSKLSDWLGYIVGDNYSPVIDCPEHITGRFNGHLETALLIRVEEGFYPGRPADKARLKHLITSAKINIERKNLDSYTANSYARVIITSNSDWVVAAALGERRYLFLDVGDAHAKDGPYFKAIDAQMASGGAEAMLHDLLAMDLSTVDFSKPPITDGLVDQMRQDFSAEEKWLESILIEGRIPFKAGAPADDYISQVEWTSGGLEIVKDTLLASFRDFVPGFRAPPTSQVLGAKLAKHVPGLKQSKRVAGVGGARVPIYILPPLAEIRAAFLANNPGYAFPATVEDEADAPARVVEFPAWRAGRGA